MVFLVVLAGLFVAFATLDMAPDAKESFKTLNVK
jgi:hypothetical protein